MVKHANYWFETCPTRHNVTSGLVRNTDVLIIGGGIAGIQTLYQLILSGVTNTYLVEEATVGYHASGRSSGQMVLRGNKLFHEMPEKDGKEYLEFISENNRRFLNGLRNSRFDSDLRQTGGLRLAINEQELERIQKECEFINKHKPDLHCKMLTAEEVAAIVPDSRFAGGMYLPTEASFNPYKVTNGVRELTEQKGNRVLTSTQVDGVTQNDDGSFSVSIRHKGTIKTKKIVYCTNAYTPELVPELKDILTPFRGQMVATNILSDEVLGVFPAMSITCNDCSEYFRLHAGRLLLGGQRSDVRGQQLGIIDDGEISPSVYEKLRSFMCQYLPVLDQNDVKLSHTWSGIMCQTPDGLPLVGQISPNAYIAAGFNGYGFAHAVQAAMIIKDLIKDGKSMHAGVKLFNPGRFVNV